MRLQKFKLTSLLIIGIIASGCGGGGGGGTPQLPDLTVSLTSATGQGVAGSDIAIAGSVTNSGTSAVTGTYSVGVYASTDNTITTSDTLLGTLTGISNLAASASDTISGNVTIPATFAAGSYQVGLIVDPQNSISESNENNNTSTTSSPLSVVVCNGSTASNVLVSWTANKEAAVNTTGGGYKVYHSLISGFAAGDAGVTVVNVPYVSGATSPTSTTLSLTSCLHYVRVAGFSALGGGTTGELSAEVSVAVP